MQISFSRLTDYPNGVSASVGPEIVMKQSETVNSTLSMMITFWWMTRLRDI